MRLPRGRPPSMRALSYLVLIYGLIIALLLVWASQLLGTVTRDDPTTLPLLVILSFIFPVFFLTLALINLARAFRQYREGEPGSRLRLRLILSFSLAIVITVLPQTLLSRLFIQTAMDRWLAPDTGAALEGGLRTALITYRGYLDRLGWIARSDALDDLLPEAVDNPEEVWEFLTDIHPEMDGLHILGSQTDVHFGDPRTRLPDAYLRRYPNEGSLPRRSIEGATVLSWQVVRPEIRIIMASVLPEGFDRDAEALTAALDAWGQYDRLKGTVGASLSLFWLFLSGPLMLLAFLTGSALSERIVRPLVQLGDATRKIAEGDFSFRVLGREEEELSFLTTSFNRMIGELEVSRIKILQTEKVAAWQAIAQRLAHELRNPLTPIKLSVQRLIRKASDGPVDPETAREVLNLVLREVDGLDSLLQDFRDFAGSGTPQKEPVRIRALLEEATSRFRAILPNVDWQTTPGDDDPEIELDPRQIRQVLVNLLNNAAEAGADTVALRLDLVTKGAVPFARFQVRDNGGGIPSEQTDKVFQPYVTTKNRGSGLGLAVVQRIIYDHRGRIWFESEPGSGTVFYVDLPAEGEP